MALQEEFEVQGNFLFKHRNKLPILAIPVGLGVFIYQELTCSGKPEWIIEGFFPYMCLIVSFFGLFIRVFTVGHAPKNTSGRNTGSGQLADQLNTTGVYSIVRHPLYLGNFFIWMGIAFLTENIWFVITFVLAFWIYYERIMYAEEQFLRKKFGDQYTGWASKTPAFIPRLKQYRPSLLPFGIKKAIKKEKNGLAAIFIVFFLFRYTETYIKTNIWSIVWDFWAYALIATSVFYLILKILKKHTSLLAEEN